MQQTFTTQIIVLEGNSCILLTNLELGLIFENKVPLNSKKESQPVVLFLPYF